MLYIPIKIYPNERSVRGCAVLAAIFLGLALAGLMNVQPADLRFTIVLICMVGFCVSVINGMAAMTRQPMLKVLDDRFSVYTPFGYALVRFGEVITFSRGGVPGMRTLRVEINRSARAKFPSGVARLLYGLTWFNWTNSVSIPGYMLGAQLDSVMTMLEKRRLAAVRLDSMTEYDPTVLTSLS